MISKRGILQVMVAAAALFSLPVLADIYKCTEESGQVTYTNVTKKGCTKLNLDPISTVPGYKGRRSGGTDASFPKVDGDTQKKRDTDRRKILEQELAAEEKNSEQAKKELAEQEELVLPEERNATVVTKVGKDGKPFSQVVPGGTINTEKAEARRQAYRDKVALHERNVEALKREIGNLK